MMHQRVHQRVLGVARGRVHHQACRFVDDKQMPVFKNNIQRNILRHDAGCFGGGQVEQAIPRRLLIYARRLFGFSR